MIAQIITIDLKRLNLILIGGNTELPLNESSRKFKAITNVLLIM